MLPGRHRRRPGSIAMAAAARITWLSFTPGKISEPSCAKTSSSTLARRSADVSGGLPQYAPSGGRSPGAVPFSHSDGSGTWPGIRQVHGRYIPGPSARDVKPPADPATRPGIPAPPGHTFHDLAGPPRHRLDRRVSVKLHDLEVDEPPIEGGLFSSSAMRPWRACASDQPLLHEKRRHLNGPDMPAVRVEPQVRARPVLLIRDLGLLRQDFVKQLIKGCLMIGAPAALEPCPELSVTVREARVPGIDIRPPDRRDRPG
jgi:hypothetical protein